MIVFEKEIKEGRLTLLNLAMSDKKEIRKFFINTRVDVWSSLDETLGKRKDENYYAIDVQCQTMDYVVSTYGVPHYMKIDIEGYDHIVLKSLTECPQYISVEDSCEQSITTLASLGYKKFKLISQGEIVKQSGNDWTFKDGSSGRFGEDTPGEWVTQEELNVMFKNTLQQTKDWFDIHATF